MTPLPKNKITRAERGKRRSGNTPNLKLNAKKAKVPMHKNRIAQKIKLVLKPVKKVDESVQKKKLAEKMAGKKAKK